MSRKASCADAGTPVAGISKPLVTRLAPSPTGPLHAGNIFAALMAWLFARSTGGSVVLRIEDLDVQRSKACFVDSILRDYQALGLDWDRGPFFQQGRDEAYGQAFDLLKRQELVFPCFCSRADLRVASAPHAQDRFVYPGTCRDWDDARRAAQTATLAAQGRAPAWRLRVPDKTVVFDDLVQGVCRCNLATDCGDFVLQRSDGHFAYHLACVVDDAAQGVNCVVRGADLLESSPQQRYLQGLLGLPEVAYAHVPLVVAADGRRLSKRDGDAALPELLARFGSPEGVMGHLAHLAGIAPDDEPRRPSQLLEFFDPATFPCTLAATDHFVWR